jgi:20S proteasome subunit alpha 6
MEFGNDYDTDVTIFSPEGKILQIEYANNATTRGNIIVGIKNINNIVFCALNEEKKLLNYKINKIFSLGENIVIMMSGIISDSKFVYKYLEKIKFEYEQGNNRNVLISWLVSNCSKLLHVNTFQSKGRPLGVKILIGGFGNNGPELFEISLDGGIQKIKKSLTGSNKQFEMQTVDNQLSNFKKKIQYSTFNELLIFLFFSLANNFKKKKNDFCHKNLQISLMGKKIECFMFDLDFTNFILMVFKNKIFFNSKIFNKIECFRKFFVQKINFIEKKFYKYNFYFSDLFFYKINKFNSKIKEI